jgi:hypothetical protein
MIAKRHYLFWALALALLNVSPLHAAEQDTVQAVIPWDGEGRVFRVDTNTMMFLGTLEGVMYVESSRGEMHEAFVMCPIMQEVDITTGRSKGIGRCEISASPDDVVFAALSCEGEVGSCVGQFTLVDGEGRFAGISGAGSLRVRSPMHALVADVSSGAVLRVASGIAIIKDLEFRIP